MDEVCWETSSVRQRAGFFLPLKEELSFIPSEVSGSDGWHEPTFMCDRQLRTQEFSTVMVGDNGELYTINICKDCYNPRLGGWKEPAVNNRQ